MWPLTVALDATYSLGRELSGVGVYSREILRGLARSQPLDRFRWCYRPHRWLASFRDSLPANCRRRLLADWPAPACDVFHGLNQRLPARLASRAACTFHDLFVLTSRYSSADFRERFARQAREAAARASLVIAVSRFTAGQVEDLLHVEASRIRVVPHGVHFPPPAPGVARERLILFLGALQTRKNVIRLVEAFERTPPGWRLVLAGSRGYGAESIQARVDSSPRRVSIELPGYISAAGRAALYARASIFAFPSLDEGFGMPVLEAMAAGVPVLTSKRSALPEVAGDAALLVEAEDSDAIAAGLRRLMEDEELRERLRGAGLLRAADFTWEAAVDRTWSVYRELAG